MGRLGPALIATEEFREEAQGVLGVAEQRGVVSVEQDEALGGLSNLYCEVGVERSGVEIGLFRPAGVNTLGEEVQLGAGGLLEVEAVLERGKFLVDDRLHGAVEFPAEYLQVREVLVAFISTEPSGFQRLVLVVHSPRSPIRLSDGLPGPSGRLSPRLNVRAGERGGDLVGIELVLRAADGLLQRLDLVLTRWDHGKSSLGERLHG